MIKEIALHEIEDGTQFIGIWVVNGVPWSDTYIKAGEQFYMYQAYSEEGHVDDFDECDTHNVIKHVREDNFKAYVLDTGATQ